MITFEEYCEDILNQNVSLMSREARLECHTSYLN